MFEDGKGFFAEFLKAFFENIEVLVVRAIATVGEGFGSGKALFGGGFGEV